MGLGEFADAARPDADADRPQGHAARPDRRRDRARDRGDPGDDPEVPAIARYGRGRGSQDRWQRVRDRGVGQASEAPNVAASVSHAARACGAPRSASLRSDCSCMRQIILDTETTGLDPKQGHRIIELAGARARRPPADRPPRALLLQPRARDRRRRDRSARHDVGRPEAASRASATSPPSSSTSRAAPSGSSTTRRSTSRSSTTSSRGAQLPRVRDALRRRDRHAGARARAVPGQAQQPRRAVRALRRRQRAAHAARRAARRAAPGRGLPRDDARPGVADDRHGAAAFAARSTRPGRPSICRRARRTVGTIAPSARRARRAPGISRGARPGIDGTLPLARARSDHRCRYRATPRRAPDPMAIDYLQKILTAKVYDVAIESPLELAPTLSRAAAATACC